MHQKELLIEMGLSEKEAELYQIMLRLGPVPAKRIVSEAAMPRGTVYQILDQLLAKGLVETFAQNKKAHYRAKHPFALKEYLENETSRLRQLDTKLDAVFEELTNAYTLAQGRPGVKFYEGREGIVKIYEELLRQGKNIDSIEDKGEMAAYIPEYSREYPSRRVKQNIFNRVIAPSDNPINPTDPKQMRESRFISTAKFPFRMDIKIAGKLVSLITFQEENVVGILIDSQEIAENFRILFEYFWQSADPAHLK